MDPHNTFISYVFMYVFRSLKLNFGTLVLALGPRPVDLFPVLEIAHGDVVIGHMDYEVYPENECPVFDCYCFKIIYFFQNDM